MPVIKKEGYKYYDEMSGGGIIIEPDKIDQYVKNINENNVVNVDIDSFWGYNLDNINFIKRCPNIEKLSIASPYIRDYSPITYLNQLKWLNIENPFVSDYSPLNELKQLKTLKIDRSPIKSIGQSSNSILDLSFVPSINVLSIYGVYHITNLNKCKNLKILNLTFYNASSKNFDELASLENLKRLTVVRSNVTSLKGLGNLKKLRRLVLSNLPKLSYIDELEKLSSNLWALSFESCKNIENHEYIAKIKSLKVLAITGSVETPNGGNISSIDFTRTLPNIKAFIFMGSNVIDGDISPCLGLEYVAFSNKKHYSHKMKDFPNDKVSPGIHRLIDLPVDENPDTED